eukprot:scaffold143_cov364-Pavlova_lutheri.AAC.5
MNGQFSTQFLNWGHRFHLKQAYDGRPFLLQFRCSPVYCFATASRDKSLVLQRDRWSSVTTIGERHAGPAAPACSGGASGVQIQHATCLPDAVSLTSCRMSLTRRAGGVPRALLRKK